MRRDRRASRPTPRHYRRNEVAVSLGARLARTSKQTRRAFTCGRGSWQLSGSLAEGAPAASPQQNQAVGSTKWILPPQRLHATFMPKYLGSARNSSLQCGHSAKKAAILSLGLAKSIVNCESQNLHCTFSSTYLL